MTRTNQPAGRGFCRSFPAVFFFFCLLAGPPAALDCVAQADDVPARTRPQLPGIIFTPESSVRALEGELGFRFGEDRRVAMPFAWSVSPSGRIEFATRDQGCLFEFSIAQTAIQLASQTIPGGIIDCTATNIASKTARAALWTAWRHAPPDEDYGRTQGVSLSSWDQSAPPNFIEDPWRGEWTWHFEKNALIRGDVKTYWIGKHDGWELDPFVRLPAIPYQNLDIHRWIGFIKLTAELQPKASATWQAFAPFIPLPAKPDAQY